MATAKPTSKITLDWSRLLGFDQAARVRGRADGAPLAASAVAWPGSKVGSKPPPTAPTLGWPGSKVGNKPRTAGISP